MKGTCKIYGGTGTCTAISGHGTYQLSILGIAARSAGKGTQNGPPVTYQQIVQGSGPVHPKRHTVRVLPRVPATGAAQARPQPASARGRAWPARPPAPVDEGFSA